MRDFEHFAEDLGPRLLRAAYLLTGSQADAEDLLQDALITIHRRWRQVSKAEHVGAYSQRVLMNQFLSSKRKKTLHVIPLDSALLNESTPDHSEEVVRRAIVREALQSLPPRQRAAVVLRYYMQLDSREMGLRMNISESTARSTLSRATQALHDLLGVDQTEWERENESVRE